VSLVIAILLFYGGTQLLKRTDWYWEVRAAEAKRESRGRRRERRSPTPPAGGRWWGRSDQDDLDEEDRDLEEYQDADEDEDPRDLDEEDREPRFHRYRPTRDPRPTHRRPTRDLDPDLAEEDQEDEEETADEWWGAPRRVRNPDGTITEIPWHVDMARNRAARNAEPEQGAAEESEPEETVEEFVARLLGCNTGYNEIVRQGVAANYAGATKMKAIIREVKADLAARQN
jgi:hypothetical protein